MPKHDILITLSVSDRQYIEIIKAQQKAGNHTVDGYLRSIVLETLDEPAPKPKKKKVKALESATITEAPAPVKKKGLAKTHGSITSQEIMAGLKSDAAPISGGEAEDAAAPAKGLA